VSLPRDKKPSEQLRRRNAPEQWTALPAEGCKLAAPKWPRDGRTPELWARLWKLPIAALWHSMQIEPSVVARYVVLSAERPDSPAVSRLETELGLTPGAMLRLRVVVGPSEPEQKSAPASPYTHLRAVSS
jgi:hypothetical protein